MDEVLINISILNLFLWGTFLVEFLVLNNFF